MAPFFGSICVHNTSDLERHVSVDIADAHSLSACSVGLNNNKWFLVPVERPTMEGLILFSTFCGFECNRNNAHIASVFDFYCEVRVRAIGICNFYLYHFNVAYAGNYFWYRGLLQPVLRRFVESMPSPNRRYAECSNTD